MKLKRKKNTYQPIKLRRGRICSFCCSNMQETDLVLCFESQNILLFILDDYIRKHQKVVRKMTNKKNINYASSTHATHRFPIDKFVLIYIKKLIKLLQVY